MCKRFNTEVSLGPKKLTECSENLMISVSLGISHNATDLSSEKLTTWMLSAVNLQRWTGLVKKESVI